LCNTDKCTIPRFLLEYPLPVNSSSSVGGAGAAAAGDASTCCIASQVVASWLSHEFLYDFEGVSPFAEQCPRGNPDFSVHCMWNAAGALTGVPDEQTYRRARRYLCEHPQCVASVVEPLFNDLVRMDRNAFLGRLPQKWSQLQGGHVDFDRRDMCEEEDTALAANGTGATGSEGGSDSVSLLLPDVAVCEMSPDFYFSVPSPRFDDDRAPSCCAAVQVVLDELAAQGLRDGVVGADAAWIAAQPSLQQRQRRHLAALDLDLATAKLVVSEDPSCLRAFYRAVRHQQRVHPGSYPSVSESSAVVPGTSSTSSSFEAFWEGEFCWMALSFRTAGFPCRTSCCTAANVVAARLLWTKNPAFGQVYFPQCPDARGGGAGLSSSTCVNEKGNASYSAFPIPDEPSFVEATDVVCGGSCGAILNGIDDRTVAVAAYCADPCRCSSRVQGLEGCGFHDAGYGRPFCYVSDPDACARAMPSTARAGEAFVHCPLPVDSCQEIVGLPASQHMCGAFLGGGSVAPTTVAVTAGLTLESMLMVKGAADAVKDELIGSVDDILGPWALESALVSILCFKAHVEFMCRARLKPCGPGVTVGVGMLDDEDGPSGAASGAGDGAVFQRDARMCKHECEVNTWARAAFCDGSPVFNSIFADDHEGWASEGESSYTTVSALGQAHCQYNLSPLRLSPYCVNGEFSKPCADAQLFDMLGGNDLLQPAYLGQSLFVEAPGLDGAGHRCTHQDSSAGAIGEAGGESGGASEVWDLEAFDVSTALTFVSCPQPFVKNDRIQASRMSALVRQYVDDHESSAYGGAGVTATAAASGSFVITPELHYDNQFCVSTCPSFVFSESQYTIMWMAYIIPGLVAFVINLVSAIGLFPMFVQKYTQVQQQIRNVSRKSSQAAVSPGGNNVPVEQGGSGPRTTEDHTMLLISASVLFGCVAIIPTTLLSRDLPCGADCTTEGCFQHPSLWCHVNKTSTFVLQIIIHCMAWKLLTLYLSLKNDFYSLTHKVVTKFGGRISVLVPVMCCAISFAIEENDPSRAAYALNFHRSGFSCRMRFPSFAAELLLNYGQMAISAGILLVVVFKIVKTIVSAFARAKLNVIDGGDNSLFVQIRIVVTALAQKPKVLKIVMLGVMALLLLALNLSLTITSAGSFASFHDDMTHWYDCVRYSFAKQALYGEESWDEAVASIPGGSDVCPPLPEEGPSVAMQTITILSEALVPIVVAVFFKRIPKASLPRGWFSSVVSTSASQVSSGVSSSTVSSSSQFESIKPLSTPAKVLSFMRNRLSVAWKVPGSPSKRHRTGGGGTRENLTGIPDSSTIIESPTSAEVTKLESRKSDSGPSNELMQLQQSKIGYVRDAVTVLDLASSPNQRWSPADMQVMGGSDGAMAAHSLDPPHVDRLGFAVALAKNMQSSVALEPGSRSRTQARGGSITTEVTKSSPWLPKAVDNRSSSRKQSLVGGPPQDLMMVSFQQELFAPPSSKNSLPETSFDVISPTPLPSSTPVTERTALKVCKQPSILHRLRADTDGPPASRPVSSAARSAQPPVSGPVVSTESVEMLCEEYSQDTAAFQMTRDLGSHMMGLRTSTLADQETSADMAVEFAPTTGLGASPEPEVSVEERRKRLREKMATKRKKSQTKERLITSRRLLAAEQTDLLVETRTMPPARWEFECDRVYEKAQQSFKAAVEPARWEFSTEEAYQDAISGRGAIEESHRPVSEHSTGSLGVSASV
jgi:hypothetical protein